VVIEKISDDLLPLSPRSAASGIPARWQRLGLFLLRLLYFFAMTVVTFGHIKISWVLFLPLRAAERAGGWL
jgi:hypothetical protein